MESTEIPAKSSNEILTELFGVFNAEPPEIVLKRKRKASSEDRNSKHGKKVKKSKKKHKHKHKHKKHKRKRSGDESGTDSHKHNKKKSKIKDNNDDDDDEGGKEVTPSGPVSVNIELPVDKVPLALEIMLDGTVGIKGEDGVITEVPDVCNSSVNDVESGVVESEKGVNGIVLSNEIESSHVQTEDSKTDNGANCENKIAEEPKEKVSETGDKVKKAKIQIKDLKFSSVYQETIKAVEEEKKKKEQKNADIEEGELVESSNDEENIEKEDEGELNEVKSSDEQSKHKRRHSKSHRKSNELEHHKKQKRKSSKVKSRSRSRSRSSHRSHDRHYSHHSSHKRHRSRSRDRRRSPSPHLSSSGWPKYSNHRSHRSDRSEDRKSKGRSKERSRSPDDKSIEKIDKDKLLEIARKNALKLIGKGILPGGEEKVTAIKAGGKTVNELTAYCKKLSEKEALEGDLSDIDSDSSGDEDKPFHHPFRVRDRPSSIVMNIKNSTPIPIKTLQEKAAEQAKQLRLQFPVSSGTSHRRSENEWVPVSSKKDQVRVTQTVTAPTPTPMLTPMPIPKPTVMPMPVPMPTPTPTPTAMSTPTPTSTPIPMAVPPPTFVPPPVPPPVQAPVPQTQLPVKPVPPPQPPMPPVVPTMPMYMTKMPPPPPPEPLQPRPVFRPDVPKMDISAIVSKRIEAIRKLQENPNDTQALQQMRSAQQEMQFWAKSKHESGAFTGSTGVRVLSVSELNSGTQAWAKRNQLTNATPVSGGMGMAMLQKMGWQPGEGLGKNKEGTLEPLKVEIKTDKKGLLAPDESKKNKRGPAFLPKPFLPTIKSFLNGKHPVSLLTELCSRRRYGIPHFELCFECGPDHKKNFLFKVRVNGVDYTPTVASPSKKQAKAEAAAVCLRALGVIPDKPKR